MSRFVPESEWLGRLEIPHPQAEPFTLRSTRGEHNLGFADQPLFYLDQAPSPDEPWDIGVYEGGRPISVDASMQDPALAQWLPDAHREAGLALAARLPQGTYLWLRSSIEPSRSKTILLGNERVEAKPNMLELWRDDANYTVIIGANDSEPPALDQPLLGVTIFNYDGTEIMQAVLFFSCLQGWKGSSTERLLVVPESGVLVLDSLARFSAEDHARCLARWTKTEARALASQLAPVTQEDA